MHNNLFYELAIALVPGIGPVKTRSLISYCGSAEAVFREKPQNLVKIPDIGKIRSQLFKQKDILERAEVELKFMEDHDIQATFFTSEQYPERLQRCDDSPVLIFSKGRIDLNAKYVVSIVGTRKATSYGKQFCKELIHGIAHLDPLIVSGLAYGIDICAHRNAIAEKLQTVGCVAHGLEKIYPTLHTSVASEMMHRGGLITEFFSHTRMTPELFPMRNRIIAGLADCTIVVETDTKGGSVITAHLANSYSRDVFAVPGRVNDPHSTGCNELIRKNIAGILTSPAELIEYMAWSKNENHAGRQLPLFTNLSEEENVVVKVLSGGKTSVDELYQLSGLLFNKLSNILLELEFKGVVKPLPGKLYELT